MGNHWDRWAAVRGVDVFDVAAADLPCIARVRGLYFPEKRAILLDQALEGAERDRVLAHELGHHALGHVPSGFDAVTARQEEEADAWAAKHEAGTKRPSGCRTRTARTAESL